MTPLTHEALRSNPELLEALMRQAHRQRAEAVHRYLVAPDMRLFAPLKSGHVQGRPAPG